MDAKGTFEIGKEDVSFHRPCKRRTFADLHLQLSQYIPLVRDSSGKRVEIDVYAALRRVGYSHEYAPLYAYFLLLARRNDRRSNADLWVTGVGWDKPVLAHKWMLSALGARAAALDEGGVSELYVTVSPGHFYRLVSLLGGGKVSPKFATLALRVKELNFDPEVLGRRMLERAIGIADVIAWYAWSEV